MRLDGDKFNVNSKVALRSRNISSVAKVQIIETKDS